MGHDGGKESHGFEEPRKHNQSMRDEFWKSQMDPCCPEFARHRR